MTGAWTGAYDRADPGHERLVDALRALGNGRVATRGSAPSVTRLHLDEVRDRCVGL